MVVTIMRVSRILATGQYRVGTDEPLWAEGGAPGSISVDDLAVAIVDELETPKHIQKRFTVAN